MVDFSEVPFHEDDLAELMQLEIDFAFQPIFTTESLVLAGYEALMRPKGKTPLELIEEYEEKGKLFVIELATCFGSALAYKKRGYTEDLCINSFPSEFMNSGQMELYHQCFPDMKEKLIVEILEYTNLNLHKWKEKRDDIMRNNMRISLDDFSTGNNGIEALNYYNPQYAKLDRSLINCIQDNTENQTKVQLLTELFHERGIRVIAEGVETKEELTYLQNHTKVDYVQGYYIGIPA